MKELTIEQKAKRYNKVIEELRAMMPNWENLSYNGKTFLQDLVYIIPELKESDGERMVKFIKNQLFNIKKTITENYELDAKLTKAIAWLEKQCEQKPVDFSDLRTWKYIIDAVLTEIGGIGQYLDSPFTEEVAKKLQKRFGNIEQKPADKVEPKFKVGDVMRTLQEAKDGITDGLPVVISVNKDCYDCTNELIFIKDQDNYEYPPINRKQNSAWSAEDESWFKELELMALSFSNDDSYRKKFFDWLKSLKDRYTWRPSDEQMKALTFACIKNAGIDKSSIKALYDLKEQLKQL